jgi:hypothetical protein
MALSRRREGPADSSGTQPSLKVGRICYAACSFWKKAWRSIWFHVSSIWLPLTMRNEDAFSTDRICHGPQHRGMIIFIPSEKSMWPSQQSGSRAESSAALYAESSGYVGHGYPHSASNLCTYCVHPKNRSGWRSNDAAAFCACCGAEITVNAEACPVCGTPLHGMSKANLPVTFDIDTDPSREGISSGWKSGESLT